MKTTTRYWPMMLATLALASPGNSESRREVKIIPKPQTYHTHIPKSARKGKTPEELRKMRQSIDDLTVIMS